MWQMWPGTKGCDFKRWTIEIQALASVGLSDITWNANVNPTTAPRPKTPRYVSERAVAAYSLPMSRNLFGLPSRTQCDPNASKHLLTEIHILRGPMPLSYLWGHLLSVHSSISDCSVVHAEGDCSQTEAPAGVVEVCMMLVWGNHSYYRGQEWGLQEAEPCSAWHQTTGVSTPREVKILALAMAKQKFLVLWQIPPSTTTAPPWMWSRSLLLRRLHNPVCLLPCRHLHPKALSTSTP